MATENDNANFSDRRADRERIFLAAEDYDNIWLRVKEKGIRWVLTWVTFIVTLITVIIATITFLGFNNYVQEKALSLTRVYVSSKEFKKEASDSLSSYLIVNQEKIAFMRSQLKQLTDSIRFVSNIKVAPYEVFANGAAFVDSVGSQFQIEYGHAETDKEVVFKRNFSETPLIYITSTSQLTQTLHEPVEKKSTKTTNFFPIVLDSATQEGFTVKIDSRYAPWGFSGTQNYNWIAIGK